MFIRKISVVWLLLFLTSHAFAGTFKVVPVKLLLSETKKTDAVRVINEGAEEVTLQAKAMNWSQDDAGEDVYVETDELAVFPKIFTAAPGEERIVRVGRKSDEPLTVEKAFRVMIKELPVSKPGQVALKMALQFSIPIFAIPAQKQISASIERIALEDAKLMVSVKNSGNRHLIVKEIAAVGLDADRKTLFSRAESGWYVLPGKTKRFAMETPAESRRLLKWVNVTVKGEGFQESASSEIYFSHEEKPDQ